MLNDHDRDGPQLKMRELMAPNPVAIQAESSLADVAKTLAEFDVSGLPVVDRSGAVIGVISQTDTVSAFASLQETARPMTEHRVHRLVVVAEPDRGPVGVISERVVVGFRGLGAFSGRRSTRRRA